MAGRSGSGRYAPAIDQTLVPCKQSPFELLLPRSGRIVICQESVSIAIPSNSEARSTLLVKQ